MPVNVLDRGDTRFSFYTTPVTVSFDRCMTMESVGSYRQKAERAQT